LIESVEDLLDIPIKKQVSEANLEISPILTQIPIAQRSKSAFKTRRDQSPIIIDINIA